MLSIWIPLIIFRVLLKIFLLDLKAVLVGVLITLACLFTVILIINVRYLKKKKALYGSANAEEKEHFILDNPENA